MIEQETRICPRCQNRFDCKLANVDLCQCRPVNLNDAQLNFIRSRFKNCLCADCLRELGDEYIYQKKNNGMKQTT